MMRGPLMRWLIVLFGVALALNTAAVVIALTTVRPHVRAGHLAGQAWSIGAVSVALLLGLLGLVWLQRSLTGPLRRATATIRGLTGGEHTLRVPVTGAAELRDLAEAINTQAEMAGQRRAAAAERDRLLILARQTVQRIREHLRVEDMLREARQALERDLGADEAYLHVIREGEIGPPSGPQSGWSVSPGFIENMPPEAYAIVEDLLARKESLVIQDVQGPEGDWIPPQLREPLRAAGIVSELLTPFGESADFYGVIVATRMRTGRPWIPAEVEAVEWIATDLAQALRQARVYEQEKRLVAEMKAVDRAKSDFLATVSHELRTPLTSIAGFAELLGDEEAGPLNPAQRRMMQTMQRNTVRLRHLIEDLLTLSKIESGTFKTAMEPVDLAGVVGAGVAALRAQAQAKGVSLEAVPPPAGVMVTGDRGQLERMLVNVLSNAVKFTPAGGRAEVGVSVQEPDAVLWVADTGIGIPETELKDTSSRFFRGSNAVERAIPGTGLGLTIVRSIVDNHHGRLELRSREGKGTTVTVRIPLSAPGQARPGPSADRASHEPSPDGASPGTARG